MKKLSVLLGLLGGVVLFVGLQPLHAFDVLVINRTGEEIKAKFSVENRGMGSLVKSYKGVGKTRSIEDRGYWLAKSVDTIKISEENPRYHFERCRAKKKPFYLSLTLPKYSSLKKGTQYSRAKDLDGKPVDLHAMQKKIINTKAKRGEGLFWTNRKICAVIIVDRVTKKGYMSMSPKFSCITGYFDNMADLVRCNMTGEGTIMCEDWAAQIVSARKHVDEAKKRCCEFEKDESTKKEVEKYYNMKKKGEGSVINRMHNFLREDDPKNNKDEGLLLLMGRKKQYGFGAELSSLLDKAHAYECKMQESQKSLERDLEFFKSKESNFCFEVIKADMEEQHARVKIHAEKLSAAQETMLETYKKWYFKPRFDFIKSEALSKVWQEYGKAVKKVGKIEETDGCNSKFWDLFKSVQRSCNFIEEIKKGCAEYKFFHIPSSQKSTILAEFEFDEKHLQKIESFFEFLKQQLKEAQEDE